MHSVTYHLVLDETGVERALPDTANSDTTISHAPWWQVVWQS